MARLTTSGLTARIEAEFATVWQQTKGEPVPAAGAADRRLLFAAVAGGVLAYLKDNEDSFLDELSVREDADTRRDLEVVEARLDIEAGA